MSEQPVNLKGLAARLNLSVSTVSRALSGHPRVSMRTRGRVKKLATELGFQLNLQASLLKAGKSFTIGLILPSLSEHFFTSALKGIEGVLDGNRYRVMIAQSHDCMAREKQSLKRMLSAKVDGILVALSADTDNFEHFEQVQNMGIPLVFFDRVPPSYRINAVTCDIYEQTHKAIKMLRDKGHRAIGLLNGPDTLLCSHERKLAYLNALEQVDADFKKTWIVDTDLSAKGTCAAITKLLSKSKEITAVLAFNDYVVLQAINYIRSRPQMEPRIDFVGYSNMPLLQYLDHTPVASIEQFPEIQGRLAAQMLMDILSENQSVSSVRQYRKKMVVAAQLINFT